MTGPDTYLRHGAATPEEQKWAAPRGSYSAGGRIAPAPDAPKPAGAPAEAGNSVLTSLLTSAAGFVLAAAFSTAAQAAQETFDVYHDPAAGDGWFARVVICNPDGSSTNTYQVQTDLGPVVMQYFTTLNTPCNPMLTNPPRPMAECADQVRVISVPDGVIPSEWDFIVRENGEATVFLSKWLGV